MERTKYARDKKVFIDKKWWLILLSGCYFTLLYFTLLYFTLLTPSNQNYYTVGKNQQFSTIQEAIDNSNDSSNNHVTILIYPGKYSKFSMRNKLRYISLIGIDKNNTIIQDDTGNYSNCPAEIRTNGIISNLTFIATHDTPQEASRFSYAVHMDFGNQNVTFDNCKLVSFQAPAAGIGLYQDDFITFKNCELLSFADNNFGNFYNLGALYVHSNINPNILNQNLTLINNTIQSKSSNRGSVFLDNIGENGEFNLTAYNNMCYDLSYNKLITLNGITLTPQSFNNNIPQLNF